MVGKNYLMDSCTRAAEVLRETGKKVFGVSSGQGKKTWNEKVQESIQSTRSPRKKWESGR